MERKIYSALFRNLGKAATIGVFGHYGNRNLGDEAIIAAVVQNIRQRLPSAKILGFSTDPDDTTARHDILAYPIYQSRLRPFTTPLSFEIQEHLKTENPNGVKNLTIGRADHNWTQQIKAFVKRIPLGQAMIAAARAFIQAVPALISETRFIRRSYKVLKDVDLLIITGSNQFLDNFGGPWGFPYRLLKWSTIAKIAGTKIIYVCVGAGPISSKLSMVMIRLALMMSDYCSLRDVQSQELIETMGVKGATTVFPDLAYSLCPVRRPIERRLGGQHGRKPTVGINPMPIYDSRYWYIDDADKYENYVKNLAQFSSALLRENYPLVFWATQPKDHNVITDVLAYLATERGEASNANVLVSTIYTVNELVDVIDTFDIAVATRFHGTVLSLFAGKAVLSICYHKKIDDLMNEMGQSEYSVMFDAFDAEDLLKRFKRLEQNIDNEVEKIKRKTDEYQKALASQYDSLFGTTEQE